MALVAAVDSKVRRAVLLLGAATVLRRRLEGVHDRAARRVDGRGGVPARAHLVRDARLGRAAFPSRHHAVWPDHVRVGEHPRRRRPEHDLGAPRSTRPAGDDGVRRAHRPPRHPWAVHLLRRHLRGRGVLLRHSRVEPLSAETVSTAGSLAATTPLAPPPPRRRPSRSASRSAAASSRRARRCVASGRSSAASSRSSAPSRCTSRSRARSSGRNSRRTSTSRAISSSRSSSSRPPSCRPTAAAARSFAASARSEGTETPSCSAPPPSPACAAGRHLPPCWRAPRACSAPSPSARWIPRTCAPPTQRRCRRRRRPPRRPPPPRARATPTAVARVHPRPLLAARSTKALLGQVDAFMSHAWADEEVAPGRKFAALKGWAASFEQSERRPPKIWLDKACIAQDNINESLACLPCFLAGCRKLLVIAGESYTTRLWCVMEVSRPHRLCARLLSPIPVLCRSSPSYRWGSRPRRSR